MRNRLFAAAFVFVAAFAFGAVAPAPVAAAGGGGDCWYECDCAGNPVKCCTTLSGGVSCKADSSSGLQCPQVYNC